VLEGGDYGLWNVWVAKIELKERVLGDEGDVISQCCRRG
jgi:hypothetical protein